MNGGYDSPPDIRASMEESEKRRERLRAMRAEAARSENSNSIEASAMPGYLSNPLVEISAAFPAQEESRRTPRFDFYTDPMAAFSGNNRRNNTNDQISSHFLTPPVNSGSPVFRSSSPLPGNALDFPKLWLFDEATVKFFQIFVQST